MSIHVVLPDLRRESISSIHSADSARIEDIFENDEIDEDDYIDSRRNEMDAKGRQIFTVGNGYGLSVEERNILSRRPSTASGDDGRHSIYLGHQLSFRGKLRKFFIRNPSTRLGCTFFELAIRVMMCVTYVVRVCLDDITGYECDGCPCDANSSDISEEINWYVLGWVDRSMALWIIEVTLSFVCLLKALLFITIARRGHRKELLISLTFFLELICDIPILVTLCQPFKLRNIFVPVYLNCWLAARSLKKIYNDLHLTKRKFQTISVTLLQQMILLFVNISCLLFTTVCTIQHIQRASRDPAKHLDMLNAFYFVIVTFSTVGYGDFSPDFWLGRVFMILTIALAFVTLPSQIQGLISTYMERVNTGGEYSRGSTNSKQHVIVCSSTLSQDSLMDFLNEFYCNPKLEDRTVILLCPQDLDSRKQVILKDPKWARRVIYIKGSALKDVDLMRCRASEAYACFFLAPRPTQDKVRADRHTILRSWAVKDYAPACKQYVYLFIAANKIHVKFADHVVCEEELSYALLANNCLYPGLSTLVSLLVHSSPQHENVGPIELWQDIYGRHSQNEIYHIQLQKSVFFGIYIGETFPRASSDAHRRFGVALLAVLDSESLSPRLQLNPGPSYRLKGGDICFYMSVTREEYSKIPTNSLQRSSFKEAKTCGHNTQRSKALSNTTLVQIESDQNVFETITSFLETKSSFPDSGRGSPEVHMSPVHSEPVERNEDAHEKYIRCISNSSTAPLLEGSIGEEVSEEKNEQVSLGDSTTIELDNSASSDAAQKHDSGQVFQFYHDLGQEKLINGTPPLTMSSGFGGTSCHMRTEPRPVCCLEWGKNCDHCTYKNANDGRWNQQLIILLAEHTTGGIFNFIVPLRSSFIDLHRLSPIVLLLEETPDAVFLETIAQFPLVYYMTGSIWSIDELLVAGMNQASHLVVVNRDTDSNYEGEEFMEDSETIVAVQTINKLFPNVTVLTELSQTSNMRFMKFSAHHSSTDILKQKSAISSNMYEIFRLPFAAGHVFSASMLDTLLYQTFTKGYLITFIRLLLGIDGEEGSGHVSSILIKKSTILRFSEYGTFYKALCLTTGEIPFAIYRTENVPIPEQTENSFHFTALQNNGIKKSKSMMSPGKSKMGRPKSHSINSVNGQHSQRRFSAICHPQFADLGSLVQKRIQSLEMPGQGYSEMSKAATFSYIISNPSPGQKLKVGDIIYVIQPSSMCATPSKRPHIKTNRQITTRYLTPGESSPRDNRMSTVCENGDELHSFTEKTSL
ncbi:unnamed protein product [Lymnaea stagnalis]|uniref:Potassium channel subfamily T member 2 n=1 Tax=Lymnaea stagnalis TaxID=6523 RepID=A0AAV2I2A1_LYMST